MTGSDGQMMVSYSVYGERTRRVACSPGEHVVFGRGAQVNGHVDLPKESASRRAVTVVLHRDGRAAIESGQAQARVVVTAIGESFPTARLADGEGLLLAPGCSYGIRLALKDGVALDASLSTPPVVLRPKPATGAMTMTPMALAEVMSEAEKLSWQFVTAFAVAVMRPHSRPRYPQRALARALTLWNGEAPPDATLNRRIKAALENLGIEVPPDSDLVPTLAAGASDLGVLRGDEIAWLRGQLEDLGYLW